ncbi:MAG: transketolase C-terminal domain-containing protein [Anaerolineae bacterium]|jgi:transketolase
MSGSTKEPLGLGLASRDAFGKMLVKFGQSDDRIVALTADLASSVRVAEFGDQFPERMFNFGVAEQNMMGAAAGLALTGKIPFVSTYAVFAALRAAEQMRTDVAHMNLPVRICVSHSGLSLGPGGPTHHSIEDIAVYRAIANMTVIVPADGVETVAALRAIKDWDGPVFMRLSRAAEPTVYTQAFQFIVGRGNVVRQGKDVSIIACGSCVGRSVQAADALSEEGLDPQVIDMASLKPVDRDLIVAAAEKSKRMVTVEEHSVIGGLGSAVSEVLAEEGLAVRLTRLGLEDEFATTGPYDELLAMYGLDAEGIAATVRDLMTPEKHQD